MAEILSQEEIDALLEVVDDNTDTPAPSNEIKDERNIVVYDFKRPNRVSKEQLRTIKGIHDKLARNLASQISSMMRSIVETKLHSVDQMTYGEFLMSLPSPTSFNVFSIKPLDGNCVLERLRESWLTVTEMYPTIEAKESSPNVVQIVSQNEIIIMVVMEIIIGNSSGMVNICYPVVHLESILSRLANRDIMMGETSAKKSRNKELKTLIGRAEVIYEAILGKTLINVNEFLELKQGDILRLDREADDKAIISIDKKEIFLAQVGLHRFRKSIKILELIRTDKDEIKEILEKYEDERKAKASVYDQPDDMEDEEI